MTTHTGFERLVATAVDFTLRPRERSVLDEHLATCSSCRAMAIGFRADASALRDIAFVPPPPRVRVAVLAAAARPVGWTVEPWKVLLAAVVLFAALVGTTIAAGAILRLIAGPSGPIDWSAVPAGPALVDDNGSLRLQAVSAHADRFVAVGSGSNGAVVVTSLDGRHWDRTGDALVFGSAVTDDVFGDDTGFQIVGSSADQPTIWTSPDGLAWSAETLDDSVGAVRSMATGNGYAVLVGSRSILDVKSGSARVGAAWSRDHGGAWKLATLVGTSQSGELTAVAWTGNGFLAIDGQEVLGSPDGVVWRQVSAALPIGATTLLAEGGRILAVGLAGDAPGVWISRDGVAWTRARLPAGATGRILAATYHGGSFVAVGGGPAGAGIWYSANGVTWTVGEPIEDGTGGLMLDVAWGRDVVVAVGALGSRAAIWSGRESQP